MNSNLWNAAIAAAATISGVLIKTVYDTVTESLRSKRQHSDRFLEDRKRAYDEFLRLNREVVRYQERLRDLSLIARAGRQVKQEVIEQFPASPMRELVAAAEEIFLIARTHSVVKIAQRIVALRGDAAAALRFYLSDDSLMYGLPFFLANRLGEEQVAEFIAAYRRDLNIGPPEGAGQTFPVMDRGLPVSVADAEEHLHCYVKAKSNGKYEPFVWPQTSCGKELTSKDMELLEGPGFRSLWHEGSDDLA